MASNTVYSNPMPETTAYPITPPECPDDIGNKPNPPTVVSNKLPTPPPEPSTGGLQLPLSLADDDIAQALEQASRSWVEAMNSRTAKTHICSSYVSEDYRFEPSSSYQDSKTKYHRGHGREEYFDKLEEFFQEHPDHHMEIESCMAATTNIRAGYVAIHLYGIVTGLPPGVLRPAFILMEWRLRGKGSWWLVGHNCAERASEGF